tara:strand:- start:63 stop:944 length:882 start_codon:yes stop_codon:yes gene_type:complete
MGVWGAGIFDSDTGLDIRGDFRDMMGDGVPVDEAVAKLIEENDPDDCEEEAAEFWFALASAQIQTGRLTELVKKRALELIASGDGLEAFARDCPEELPARKRALKRLEKRILGKQKKPTKIKKPFVDTIEWEAGDGLAYQLPSGMWMGFKLLEISYRTKNPEVFFEVLDLYQQTIPTPDEMRKAGPHIENYARKQYIEDMEEAESRADRLEGKFPNSESRETYLVRVSQKLMEHAARSSVIILSRNSKRDQPPGLLKHVASGLQCKIDNNHCGTCFGGWKDLDAYLERDHGLK